MTESHPPPQRATTTARRRFALNAVVLLTAVACLSNIRSTEGGRRESRRECLAAARNAGWRVLDIGNAVFNGAGRYDVSMVVEKDSVPRQSLSCSYDFRTAISALRTPSN